MLSDLIFKIYFSFFYKAGHKGVVPSILVLTFPVSMIIYLVVLTGISSFVRIREMGALIYCLGVLITFAGTNILFRHRYLNNKRYERITINHLIVWRIVAVFLLLVASLSFSIGTMLLF